MNVLNYSDLLQHNVQVLSQMPSQAVYFVLSVLWTICFVGLHLWCVSYLLTKSLHALHVEIKMWPVHMYWYYIKMHFWFTLKACVGISVLSSSISRSSQDIQPVIIVQPFPFTSPLAPHFFPGFDIFYFENCENSRLSSSIKNTIKLIILTHFLWGVFCIPQL